MGPHAYPPDLVDNLAIKMAACAAPERGVLSLRLSGRVSEGGVAEPLPGRMTRAVPQDGRCAGWLACPWAMQGCNREYALGAAFAGGFAV